MVEASAEALDRAYGALAHATRRDILRVLCKEPARVTEVARPFAMSLAAVSKHVRVLETAGLVRRTVIGRDHVLSALPQGLADAERWIAVYRAFWEPRLDALDRVLRDGAPR